jgi:hypothetical protein
MPLVQGLLWLDVCAVHHLQQILAISQRDVMRWLSLVHCHQRTWKVVHHLQNFLQFSSHFVPRSFVRLLGRVDWQHRVCRIWIKCPKYILAINTCPRTTPISIYIRKDSKSRQCRKHISAKHNLPRHSEKLPPSLDMQHRLKYIPILPHITTSVSPRRLDSDVPICSPWDWSRWRVRPGVTELLQSSSHLMLPVTCFGNSSHWPRSFVALVLLWRVPWSTSTMKRTHLASLTTIPCTRCVSVVQQQKVGDD